ncbi:MAG: hypothetical protein WC897_02300 [Candidatus Gracilibacteria bacterium]
MKKLITLLIACSLVLISCGEPKEDPVDIAGEMQNQAKLTLSLGNTILNGSNGSFCSAVLCFDQGIPNPATLKYTTYTNGTPLTVNLSATDNTKVESIFLTLKDEEWKTIQNNITYNADGAGAYTTTDAFHQTGNVILNVKVKWIAGGYSNAYFPLAIQ